MIYIIIIVSIVVLIGVLIWLKISIINGRKCQFSPNLDGKVAIITGGNAGIGYYTALKLGELGATVILACRNQTKA